MPRRWPIWLRPSRKAVDVILRCVPGHVWVRVFVSWTGQCEAGHGWMYKEMVRRDAWQFGRVGFGVIRMPSWQTADHEADLWPPPTRPCPGPRRHALGRAAS